MAFVGEVLALIGTKSTQRGSVVTSLSSGTATITAVDMAKTQLRLLGYKGDAAATTITELAQFPPYIELTNTTTITATRAGSDLAITWSWELTETNG